MSYSDKEIMEYLSQILRPWLDGISGKSLSYKTDLFNDLGIDSVGLMQFVAGIEKKFKILIDDSELDYHTFTELKNLVELIKGKLNETG